MTHNNSECFQKFRHASGLSRHLLTHSGLSYRCAECGRAFNDKSSIRRHVLTVHAKRKENEDANCMPQKNNMNYINLNENAIDSKDLIQFSL